jgi:O-antigen ligase
MTAWEGSLHSHYLGTLQNAGLVGIIAYVLLLTAVLLQSSLLSITSPNASPQRNAAIGAAFAALLLTFSYGYELRSENGLMLVLGMILARRPRSALLPSEQNIEFNDQDADSIGQAIDARTNRQRATT